MAKFSKIWNTFATGEISPARHGRTDLEEQYQNALYRCENFIVSSKGGLNKRSGTRYIKDITSSIFTTADDVRIIPFVFSKEESYAVIIGATTEGRTTAARPVATEVLLGDRNTCVIINTSDTAAAVTIDTPTYRAASPYTILVNTSNGIKESTEADANEHGIAEEYTAAELKELQYTQINDVLVIVHKNHPPLFLVRTDTNEFIEYSHRDFAAIPNDSSFTNTGALNAPGTVLATWAAQWALGVPFRDVVYDSENQPQFCIDLTSVSIDNLRDIYISNAAVWGGFTEKHIGSIFRATYTNGGGPNTGVVVIGDVTDENNARAYVIKGFDPANHQTLPATPPTNFADSWQEAAWSDARGWPRTVAFHENRLFYGGNTSEPDTVWASQSGDIAQMTPSSDYADVALTASASDPFSNGISSNESNAIQWINSQKTLVIGTLGREYLAEIVEGTSTSSLSLSPQTARGSSYLQAKAVDNTLIFVERSNRQLREFVFNFNEDNYRSEDISFLADHMVSEVGWKEKTANTSFKYPRITELTLLTSPENILFCLNNNKGLFGVTRDRSLNVLAFHRHLIGGTNSQVWSIGGIPNPNQGAGDDLWIIVSRTINSATKYYVEKIDRDFLSPVAYNADDAFSIANNDIEAEEVNIDMYFVDSAVEKMGSVSGGAITKFTSFNNLSHLEGQTIKVIGDGFYLGELTVASGAVTLPVSCEYAIGGLSYTARMITLPLEAGSQIGSAQIKDKQIDEIMLRLYNSAGCKFGRVSLDDEDVNGENISIVEPQVEDLVEINFQDGSTPLDHPMVLYTGDKDEFFIAHIDKNAMMSVESDYPFPLRIAALVVSGETHD